MPMELFFALWAGHVGLRIVFYSGRTTDMGRDYARFMADPARCPHQSALAWVTRGLGYGFIVAVWVTALVNW